MVRRVDNEGTTVWTKYIENSQDTQSSSQSTENVGFSIAQVNINYTTYKVFQQK